MPINRLKMFYFYSNSRLGLKEYLKFQKKLRVRLLCDHEVMCIADFDLRDFHSPLVDKKEYFLLMSGDLPVPVMKASIGISEGEMEDISRYDLKHHNGVYVPPEDFTACETLPTE